MCNRKKPREYNKKGDSLMEIPTYIKHWEEATPDGWQIRILAETGLTVINCKWKKYRRPGKLSWEKAKKRS